jgi:membrane protease YdiL (CAAX protease family)
MDKKLKAIGLLASAARCVFFFGVFLFVPSLLTLLVGFFAKLLEASDEAIGKLTTPIMIASYAVIILVLSLFFLLLKTNIFKVTKTRITKPRYLIDGALLGIGLYGIFQGAVTLLSLVLPKEIIESQNAHSSSILGGGIVLAVIYTVIIAPICEELVFRGLMISSLEGAMKKPIAVLITAILFSVVHLPSLIALGYTFLLGLILGFVYIKTKSLFPCIILHMLFNASNYLSFIPNNIGIYILFAICIPFTVYASIDIFRKARN